MNSQIVFMGSPDFAVPSLRSLVEKYTVIGVITQPDRPAGRGQALTPSPIKSLAQALGLTVIQPVKLRQPDAIDRIRQWAPDLIVVAAFGQILRREVLELPPYGCINVHASLLPRWRGAAPINAAILNGDRETGVTIMKMDTGVDTGPILGQRSEEIQPDDTTARLSQRLAEIGARLLIDTLPGYLAGGTQPVPQDDAFATYAPMLRKEDGALNFKLTANDLERQVRAFQPWPGAYMDWSGSLLKILNARAIGADTELGSGARLVYDNFPAVQTSHGQLVLLEVQPAGKKPMSGKAFLQGARNWA